INTPGAGYRLRAAASRGGESIGITPIDSVPFSVQLVVLNTLDSGPGSLRNAILLANASPNRNELPDVVRFSIPTIEGTPRIVLASPLPGLDEGVVIDGTPGGACTGAPPAVEINAGNTTQHGFFLSQPGTTIRGLSITGFASS